VRSSTTAEWQAESLRRKNEEGALSEKATRNDLDYAPQPNKVPHNFGFCSRMQLWSCKTAYEQNGQGDSGLKKEILFLDMAQLYCLL
jgi:hypothetical protein